MMTTSAFTLKNFAYQTVKCLQSECHFDLSRSHIYELLACYEGYASYAAFRAGNIVINVQYDNTEEYEQHRLLQALTLDILNHPPKTNFAYDNWDDEDHLSWDDYEGKEFLDHIQKLMQRLNQLSDHKLSKDFLLHLIKVLYREFLFLNLFYMNLKSVREALSYIDFENGKLSASLYDEDGYDDEDDLELIACDNGDFYDFKIIERHLPDLQKFIAKGNKDAIGIIAKYYLYLANQIAPYGREGSNFGAVWDNNKMRYTGETQAKLNRKKFEDLIEISQKYQNMIENFPINIHEVDFDHKEITSIQLKYLANQGDLDAIEYLLYHRLFKDEIEAWTYIYIAKKLGTDYTQDDYHAINAYTGEAYDDYGPLEVVGRGAIQYEIGLSKLNDVDNQYALEQAEEILQHIK